MKISPFIVFAQKRDTLLEGCLLSSIAHAIMVSEYPDSSYEQSWDAGNYNIQDAEGNRGTISFNDKMVIGAFHALEYEEESLDLLKEVPKSILEYAEKETFQHLLDEDEVGVKPFVTSIFWSEYGDSFYSLLPEIEVIERGAFLIETQLKDIKSAKKHLIEYYNMNHNQAKLLELLFEKKVKNPSSEIVLTDQEIKLMGNAEVEGIIESKEFLREIGIVWN
ncbi:hypothetical protein [Metabacillus indicus]|uniref:Uncharacterized protein n=1 Tax=Metabacillus indicus TaxID=246786 RepID=A0A084GKV0_METID|nr:hypothetical protein [Metabacillus indicus]KEZ47962.1 hypothetical protein GS18_0218460 [Metabacillus indicus]